VQGFRWDMQKKVESGMERTNPLCLLLITNPLAVWVQPWNLIAERERERDSLYSRVRRMGGPLFYNGPLGLLFYNGPPIVLYMQHHIYSASI
jgi:hypothetical protein